MLILPLILLDRGNKMEFRQYKETIVKLSNNMIENLLMQLEEREQFYIRLIEEKEINHKKLVQAKDKQLTDIVKQKQQLEKENTKLKEELNIKKEANHIVSINNIQDVNHIMRIGEEDYHQLIDDIQKAYIMESQRMVEYCLNDLIYYSREYKPYMKTEDFWSSVFIAYVHDRDEEVIKAYGEFDNGYRDGCPEELLYKKLLKLRDSNKIIENYEEARNDIRNNNKIGLNLHAYIRNELLQEIDNIIEQMYRDFRIGQENILPNVEVVHEDEQSEMDQLIERLVDSTPSQKISENTAIDIGKNLYSIEQINRAIKIYTEQEQWKKLNATIKYVIKNYEYYQSIFEYDNLYDFLFISYIFGYDKIFIERFAVDEQVLMNNKIGYDLYHMLQEEKNMPLYIVQCNCANKVITKNISKGNIFRIINAKILFRKIQTNTIPYIGNIWVNDQVENIIKPSGLWNKTQVFAKVNGKDKMVLIEAWQKRSSLQCFISKKELSVINANIAPYRLRTKGNTDTVKSEDKQVYDQVSNNIVGGYASHANARVVKSKQEFDGKEMLLSDQSVLKVMGYSTTKSREERWRILNQVAIPQLGKQRVVGYLKFFVKLHRSKISMDSAVKEWEYDLRRLETLYS